MINKPIIFGVAGWAQRAEALYKFAQLLNDECEVRVFSTASLLDDYYKRVGNESVCDGISEYAKELNYKINQLSCSCVLMGWSMGGLVALEYVNAYKNDGIDKVILVSSTPKFVKDLDYECGVDLSLLTSLHDVCASNPKVALRKFFKLMYSERYDSNLVKEKIDEALEYEVATLQHGLKYLRDADLRRYCVDVKLPLLVIQSKKDKVIPFSAGEFLLNNMSNSRGVFVENADHSMISESPELVVDCIKDFLLS